MSQIPPPNIPPQYANNGMIFKDYYYFTTSGVTQEEIDLINLLLAQCKV